MTALTTGTRRRAGPEHCGYGRLVEIVFTALLVLAAIAIMWFAVYVVYRLYADQR